MAKQINVPALGQDVLDLIGNLGSISTQRVLGRATAGSGAVEELTISDGLSLANGALNLTYRAHDVINIRDYESLKSGSSWTPAFNQALVDAAASTSRTIYFPYDITDNNGNYSFGAKPNAVPVGIKLMGENPRQFLIRDYAPSGTVETAANAFLVFDGSGYTSNPDWNKGEGMINLGIGAGNGTTGGIALMILGTSATNRGGYAWWQNVVISFGPSSNGTWRNGLIVDGSAVTTAGSQGCRDHQFLGLYIFRCTGDSAIFRNNVHLHIHGMTVSDGGAGNPNPRVLVTGGGSATSNSTQCLMTNLDLECRLRFENCSRVVAMGYVDEINSAASATQCKFIGIANTNSTVAGTTVV